MVAGGRMVLSLMGRISEDPTAEGALWIELLSLVLMAMASEVLTSLCYLYCDGTEDNQYSPSLVFGRLLIVQAIITDE